MLEHYWILILFPLFGFLVNGIAGRRLSHAIVGWVACSAVGLSFLVSLLVFVQFVGLPAEERTIRQPLYTWIESGNFSAQFSFLLDPLSMVMILIVTGVSFLIHVYSVEYMAGEEGFYRYFSYLNLFVFMMSILVLADNYLLMFVGWEGVGLCSYLLIGYYLDRKSAGDAAKKAFIVNRIGDAGFLLGILLLFREFGGIDYLTVFRTVADQVAVPEAGFGVLGAITLLLFMGATGKSAQIPLYVWLPDAMEGPTPVSALIHAATMVTAGVYVIARSAPLYSRAPDTLLVVAVIGTATALLAAIIATVQRDIKRVLAYSTISQLGYMFLAVGVGAFAAGVFHLYTHAFFKALLFLGSGSVILALHHEQDLFRMGRLKPYLPVTFWTMWIGSLAISGVPLLSGFFSKDEILWKTYSAGPYGRTLWLVGVIVAILTAFYMLRWMFLIFYDHGDGGRAEAAHGEHDVPREPSYFVRIPLLILAFFAIVGGYVGLPDYIAESRFESFLEPSFRYQYVAPEAAADAHGHLAAELILTGVALLAAAIGIGIAYYMYRRAPQRPTELSIQFRWLYQLAWRRFFIDEIYESLVVRPISRFSSRVLWKGLDTTVIDGLVNGTATFMQKSSEGIRRLQSGYTRTYALWILGGAVLIFLYYSLS